MPRPTLYIVHDNKPGHLSQSRGLAQAIVRQTPARVMELDAEGKGLAPQPEGGVGLILAAGRKTHRMAVLLRKYLSLPAVVLMNPGWINRQRFDLSVIPKHDRVKPSASVIVTEGALNDIVPGTGASLDRGLLLIGGPSKHYGWETGWVEHQVKSILEQDPSMKWSATNSRRTPEATSSALSTIAAASDGRLTYTPVSQTPGGWVGGQLQRCGVCWVSEDSVSMVYEALTAGAQVGLLPVKKKPDKISRVARGVDSLVERGWVTAFSDWEGGKALAQDRPPLAEADRIASLICQRYLADI